MNDTLRQVGYSKPTPIQEQTLPALLEKKDMIGLAQTGTGKTAAFMIPILENIFPPNKKVQALIMCPTRELAMQTAKVAKELSGHIKGLRTVSVYGGQPASIQIRALRAGAQIVVGTPGRLKDLIKRNVLKLKMCIRDRPYQRASRYYVYYNGLVSQPDKKDLRTLRLMNVISRCV